MIPFLIKLLMLSLILYGIIYIYTSVKKALVSMNSSNGSKVPMEACPVCSHMIQVSGDDMTCPKCGTKLGRTQEGKLVIKVN